MYVVHPPRICRFKLKKCQVAALNGYENANTNALKIWEEVYGTSGTPLIALTDTFTTNVFFRVSAMFLSPKFTDQHPFTNRSLHKILPAPNGGQVCVKILEIRSLSVLE